MAENNNLENKDLEATNKESMQENGQEKTDGKKKGEKPKKMTKSEKKEAKANAREKSRRQKEWEESIVASKRVIREERRRKFKKLMVFLLVFALIVTSSVYIMTLFIDENNIRITANSSNEKTISLSMDNQNWSPFIDALGPDEMWDLSYNPVYGREIIPTIADIETELNKDEPTTGNMSGSNFIGFTFMLRNSTEADVEIPLVYEMTLTSENKGLENAIRILWSQKQSKSSKVDTKIYAALSKNDRLKEMQTNFERNKEDGYIEKVSYPVGSDDENYSLHDYEKDLSIGANSDEKWQNAINDGYFDTVPFMSNELIFQNETLLKSGEILYVYVVVWVEGSDFDCVDKIMGTYVKLGINFVVAD